MKKENGQVSVLERIFKPRHFQAYCVGTAKSGTHSIAAIFSKNYRAAHEPNSEEFIDLLFAVWNGSREPKHLRRYIKERDKRLWLEIDSSQLNYFVLDILVQEFPKAKFILTIRDCYSWLDSLINHQLARDCSQNWYKLRDVRFKGKSTEYAPEEEILARHNLYTLDGYLSYWAKHNKDILAKVPNHKLLIVKTNEISSKVAKISDFLGVNFDELNTQNLIPLKLKVSLISYRKLTARFLKKKLIYTAKALWMSFSQTFIHLIHYKFTA